MSRSALILGAASLLLAACQPQEEAEAPRPPVVRADVVHLASMAEMHSYTGVVKPRREVPSAFRIDGKIESRAFDVGDVVKAGDVLATLDDTDLKLSLESAGAELEAAKANLDQARTDQKRIGNLADGGVVSRSSDEQRRLATEEATARLEKAGHAVALAKNQLEYATLRASHDAVVTAVSAEPGQVVAVGAPVLTLAPMEPKEVEIAVPEGQTGDLDGATASVTLWAGGSKSMAAHLREMSPQADATSRTYLARYTIDEPTRDVRFGMTATVTLMRGDPKPVVQLPTTAVLDEGQGPTVFVVGEDGKTLKKTPVTIRRFGERDVVIESGLAEGERVVTLGVNQLQDGEVVRVAVEAASAD